MTGICCNWWILVGESVFKTKRYVFKCKMASWRPSIVIRAHEHYEDYICFGKEECYLAKIQDGRLATVFDFRLPNQTFNHGDTKLLLFGFGYNLQIETWWSYLNWSVQSAEGSNTYSIKLYRMSVLYRL
jgi:hypothetical protein